MAENRQNRTAEVTRKTNETDISVKVDLDGSGTSKIATGIGFFDHMLEQLSRHSLIDMEIEAKGDLHIDDHHTVEDTGIAIGIALAKALGERRGIVRYASLDLAMDETLTRAAVDVSGRPFLVWDAAFSSPKIGTFDTELCREFFPGPGAKRRNNPARHQSLRCQQPSYCRNLFQGGGKGPAHGNGDRSAPGRPHPVNQRDAGVTKGA